ncbi:MAG: SCO family protein, partial [Rhodospirillales bacterium]|nr:SCO family protein [Rhodospirillales bacterium]
TKGFDHLDQVTVIDSDGIVQTQVYGASFNTPLLVDPLKRIVFGTSTPYASLEDLIKKVRLFCTIYDPALDRYRFDYSIFIRLIVGATFLIALGSFLARELWRGRKRRKKTPSAGSTPA